MIQTSRLAFVAVIAAGFSIAGVRPAAADGASIEHRLVAIEGSTGLGTPLGLLGISAELRPLPYLSIGGGGGVGVSGPQLGVMARFDVNPHPRREWTLGVGFSTGRWGLDLFDGFCPGGGCEEDREDGWDWARWVSAEVAGGQWTSDALRVRAFGGVSYLLNAVPDQCADCTAEQGRWLPFVGCALAFAP